MGFLIQFFKPKNCDNINLVCLWLIKVSFSFKIRKSLFIWHATQTTIKWYVYTNISIFDIVR